MTDTSELVRRLRFWIPIGSKNLEEDLVSAADRLEALEAEVGRLRAAGTREFMRFEAEHEDNKRLREALSAIVRCYEIRTDIPRYLSDDMLEAARAALKEGER